MEKKQQNQGGEQPSLFESQTTGNPRPGQQLPTENPHSLDESNKDGNEIDRHSESSFPKKDEETLGTP